MTITHHIQLTSEICQKGVVVIGKFDGVHRGHQHLLLQSQRLAQKNQIPLVVIILTINSEENVLTTQVTKLQILQKLLPNAHFILQNLTESYQNYTPEKFIQDVLCKYLRPRFIVVGQNFHFGYQRTGDTTTLQKLSQKYGYQLHIVNLKKIEDGSRSNHPQPYTSTLARSHISAGCMSEARLVLGRYWWIDGQVIKGAMDQKVYHSANMDISQYVQPRLGIYATYTKIIHNNNNNKTWYPSIAYFGHAATTLNRAKPVLEVHLLNQNLDLYDRSLRVVFLNFLRPDEKFSCRELLNFQIKDDILRAKLFIENIDINLSEYE